MKEQTHDSGARISADLLDRYLAGACDDHEARRVAEWLGNSAGDVRQHVLRLGAGVPLEETAAAFVRLRKLLHEDAASTNTSGAVAANEATRARQLHRPRIGTAIPGRLGRLATRATLAASAVAVAGIVALSVFRSQRGGPAAVQTYATATGQRAVITLDDGTRVTLAPRTSLRLTRFDRTARQVDLDGEAYFEVTHTGDAPFLVQSGRTSTRVLGTSFLVRHYASDVNTNVAVASGKVAVTRRSSRWADALTLTAGRSVAVNDSTRVVSTADLTAETGWIRDELVFRNAPITEVLATLSRWYGYEFRYTDSTLVHQVVTIGLSTRSSAEALSTLKRILDVNIMVNGNTVTFVSSTARSKKADSYKRNDDTWTYDREVGR